MCDKGTAGRSNADCLYDTYDGGRGHGGKSVCALSLICFYYTLCVFTITLASFTLHEKKSISFTYLPVFLLKDYVHDLEMLSRFVKTRSHFAEFLDYWRQSRSKLLLVFSIMPVYLKNQNNVKLPTDPVKSRRQQWFVFVQSLNS